MNKLVSVLAVITQRPDIQTAPIVVKKGVKWVTGSKGTWSRFLRSRERF